MSFVVPPVLKEPRLTYEYVERVAGAIRAEIGLDAPDVLDFEHLIHRFRELQTVLIPVLWGARDRHENALHIHLPESATTWVYLNLDSEVHDFKFWMAHELAHVLAPPGCVAMKARTSPIRLPAHCSTLGRRPKQATGT